MEEGKRFTRQETLALLARIIRKLEAGAYTDEEVAQMNVILASLTEKLEAYQRALKSG